MEYTELLKAITEAQSNLDNATTVEETNYFGSQLLSLEEKLESTINKGRK